MPRARLVDDLHNIANDLRNVASNLRNIVNDVRNVVDDLRKVVYVTMENFKLFLWKNVLFSLETINMTIYMKCEIFYFCK